MKKISWNQFKVHKLQLPSWLKQKMFVKRNHFIVQKDFEFCTIEYWQMTNLICELAMYETWNVLYCKHKQKQYRRAPIYQLFSFLSKSLTFIEFYWFLPSSWSSSNWQQLSSSSFSRKWSAISLIIRFDKKPQVKNKSLKSDERMALITTFQRH